MQQAQLYLVVGEDEFRQERGKKDAIAAIRTASTSGNPTIETFSGSSLDATELSYALSPSLFGDEKIIVVENLEAANKANTAAVIAACKDIPAGMWVILLHSGGGAQKSQVPALKKLAAVIPADKLKAKEKMEFVINEFRRHGAKPTPDVCQMVLERVGSELRELAAAISQLVADTAGNVTPAAIDAYYQGVAEVSGFDCADLALAGNTKRAVASTRRALQLGIEPVVLASALQMKVAQIARLYGSRGEDKMELASQLGMPVWQVDKSLVTARRWSDQQVAKAVVLMAELDGAVKGQGGDPDYAVEAAVRQLAQIAAGQ